MNNFVILIGILKSIYSDFIELDVENLGIIKIFVDNDIDNNIYLNKITKIEGELTINHFPFPVVKANKIFQLKEFIN